MAISVEQQLRLALADMIEILTALSPCDCEKCEVKIAHAKALLAEAAKDQAAE